MHIRVWIIMMDGQHGSWSKGGAPSLYLIFAFKKPCVYIYVLSFQLNHLLEIPLNL